MPSKLYSFLFRWLLAVQLVVAPVAANCPGFRLGTTSCTSGIFSKSSISASCASDGNVAVQGTVTAPSAFDNAEVTFVPCIRSTGVCFDEYEMNGGKICDLISTTDGSDCGSAGTYYIEEEFDVPDAVIEHSWAMRFVTIKVLIDNQETCEQNATTTSSSASFMATGMASLFAVGGLSMYFFRRRRRRLLVSDEHDGLGEGHGFVYMNEISPSVSSIGIRGAFSNAYV